MKMDVPYIKVCDISTDILDNILNNIDEDDWFKWDYRKNVANMDDCNSIPIHHTPLCASGWNNMKPILNIRKEPSYDKYYPLIEPILERLKKYYDYNQYATFLARLRPNATIGFHCDSGNFLTLCHRIHVPLKTNPKVYYCIENAVYHWEKGSIYEFDNTRVHGVKNESIEDRIHLIINLYNLEKI